MIHNPKRRRIGIEAVRGEDGTPIFGKDESMEHLGRFWGEKFKAVSIEEDGAREFVAKFSVKFPEASCVLG